MAKSDFLKHFITEPVYVIPGDKIPEMTNTSKEEEASAVEVTPTSAATAELSPAPVPHEATKLVKELQYKGNNNKGVLVIVDQNDETYIKASDEAFLTKILQAVKLDINEIAIANYATNPDLNRNTLFEFNVSKYLVFGVDDTKIFKEELPPYQIIQLENNQILNCSSLTEIAGDATQKKLLWTSLQKMFL